MKPDYDIAVIGSGFSGSLMAMVARRLGHSVLLIERGSHPRFVIGESSTPLTNLMLDEIGETYDLPFLKHFSKWGTWQSEHANIGCGLKRGFTFLKHERGSRFEFRDDHSNELLVAASPNDRISDTHWYRPDFDQFLQQTAVDLGVDYLEQCEVNGITWEKITAARNSDYWGRPVTLNLLHQNQYRDVKVRLVIDASGPRGCLWNLLALDEMPFVQLPETQAVFSHFRGVEELGWPTNDTPYPPESAAVHHVFDGGWIWVLRFNNGLTSAGAIARRELANDWRFSEGETGWKNALEQLPGVRDLFESSKATEPFRFLPQVSFRTLQVSGPGWVMLPSAAGFVDPLLSTGFPLALRGVLNLGKILKQRAVDESIAGPIARYAEQTVLDLDLTGRLVAALYWNMNDFALFVSLTKLYFTAVSFAETSRRLGREVDHGFLLRKHSAFGPAMRRCIDRAIEHGQTDGSATASRRLQEEIARTIQPFDVIGLSRPDRANWYPADNADLLANRSKLNATEAEIEDLVRRFGL